MNPFRCSAMQIAGWIARGETSAREVVDAHLARIAEVNPRVRAVTRTLEDTARAEADAVDRARAAGAPLGPLAGVPFTVKENIDVKGSATTHGVPALREAMPRGDAPIVERLRSAGAIPIARTNLPDMSLRFHTNSQLVGATANPWDARLSPGGSSGGEGVAIATGMSALGLGNDAGGSVRVPALFGGVAALKPSYGRFPGDRTIGRDLTLASQLIPVDGVLARTVADLALAFRVLAGSDPRDPRAVDAPVEGPALGRPIRVGVASDPGGLGADAETLHAIEAAAAALSDAGYAVEPIDIPRLGETLDAYGRMIMTEFHLVRPMLERLLGADGRRYIELATARVEAPVDLAEYVRLTAVRMSLQRDWAELLVRYPVVLGPVFTEPPPPIDFDIAGPAEHERVTIALRLCSATSFVGVPAVAVPTGVVGGLPRGVQVISAMYREDVGLAAAAAIEERRGVIGPIDPRAQGPT